MNIMIVGVGGQGTLLASRVLGNTVVSEGYDVKLSEVHGMSQRGGSVVTYVKFGDKVYSPIIDKGEADIILAFELLEAYRALPYLKKGGKIIVNTQEIDPMPVIVGAMEYPKNIAEKIGKKADIIPIDALKYAKEAGIKYSDGLSMLVWQAAFAQEIWNGVKFSNDDIEKVIKIAQKELEKNG